MATSDYRDVTVVLGHAASAARAELETALADLGVCRIGGGETVPEVERALAEGAALLIVDAALDGGFNDMVRRLRHGAVGPDPFIVVITVTTQPTPEMVRAIIGSGADTVMVRPFAAADLAERVARLAQSRKRFVVTTEYVGPDRRQGPARPGAQVVPTFEVPNALRNAMTRRIDPAAFRHMIAATQARINHEKVERHAFQIAFLVKRLVPKLGAGLVDVETDADLARLVAVGEDICRRIGTTRHAAAGEKCMSLLKVASHAHHRLGTGTGVDANDVRLLVKLSDVIGEAFAAEPIGH